MNPGPIAEAGQTARSVINNLKESPGTLALVLFNITFLAFVWWSTSEERTWREHVVEMMVEQQTKMSEKLFECVPFKELQQYPSIFGGKKEDNK